MYRHRRLSVCNQVLPRRLVIERVLREAEGKRVRPCGFCGFVGKVEKAVVEIGVEKSRLDFDIEAAFHIGLGRHGG